MCCALALLELPPSAKLPPLEALFTVDEETGLTGGGGDGGWRTPLAGSSVSWQAAV